MRTTSVSVLLKPWIAQLTGFILTAGIEFGLWELAGGRLRSSTTQIFFWIGALLMALVVSVVARNWIRSILSRQVFEDYVEENRRQREVFEKRLNGVFRLNQLLIDAQSEKELIETSLGVITETNGAVGSSFVPFDEWGVALPPYTFGSFPPAVLRAWAEHLNSPAVRKQCRNCSGFEVNGSEPCHILGAPFINESIQIYCLPLERSDKIIGMLNLYFPAKQVMSSDQYEFTRTMLHEMVLAVEMLRLRNQELATLRQIQLAAGNGDDLKDSVQRLVQSLREVIDFNGIQVEIKPDEPRFAGLHLIVGQDSWFESSAAKDLTTLIMAEAKGKVGSKVDVLYYDQVGTVLTLPLFLTNGTVIGALILTADPETLLQRQHLSLIETVAAETALIAENQRVQLDGQYRVIMQERTRLAREIHDSLAQTLAYLKLSAAQMQSQLAHGDLTRLEQTLNQSYQALSEAYLETREVIDNLRLIPQHSFADLLKQMAGDFENSSGLKVETGFPVNTPEISPEVQAQLLRVVQEALSNVRKHSGAHLVNLSMSIWNHQLLLEISDDGIGFDAEDVPVLSRYGLQGMRERAELIGADFQIISQAGKGTRIRVLIPLNLEEKLV